MPGLNRQLGHHIIPSSSTCYQNQKNPLSLCLLSCWEVCSALWHLFTLQFFLVTQKWFPDLQFSYHLAQRHWIRIGSSNSPFQPGVWYSTFRSLALILCEVVWLFQWIRNTHWFLATFRTFAGGCLIHPHITMIV